MTLSKNIFNLMFALATLFTFGTAQAAPVTLVPSELGGPEPLAFYSIAGTTGFAAGLNTSAAVVDGFTFTDATDFEVTPNLMTPGQLYNKTTISPLGYVVGVIQGTAGKVYSFTNNMAITVGVGSGWQGPLTVTSDPTAQFPVVGVDYNSNGYALWGTSAHGPIYYSTLTAGATAWSTPAAITGSIGKYPVFAVNSNVQIGGDATLVAIWVNTTTGNIDSSTWYGSWSAVTTLGSSNGTYPRIEMDGPGNATALWIDAGGNVNTAYMPFHGTWTGATIISSGSTAPSANPSLAVDPAGDVYAAWQDSTDTIFAASKPVLGSWQTAQAISPVNGGFVPEIAADPVGNAIAVWFDGANNIQSATLPYNQSWSMPTQLSITAGENPKVTFVNVGDAVIVWFDIPSDNLLGLNETFLFPPIPPSNFFGEDTLEEFLTQKDCIHFLQWTPSPDPSVTSYLLLRNSEFLASIPPSGPYYFVDHNRCKQSADIYTLMSVNLVGATSLPLTVTLKGEK
jgi:hypothetical protein